MKDVKYLLSLITLLLIVNKVVSQVEECKFIENENFSSKYVSQSKLINSNQTVVCLNLHFNILRETSGTGGLNVNDLPLIVNTLNEWYNDFNVFFKQYSYDEILNSDYYTYEDDEYQDLIQLGNHRKTNAINIYLVENTPGWYGSTLAGSNVTVIKNSQAFSVTTPHEVAHCFGIRHTHHNIDSFDINLREQIARSGSGANCSTTGGDSFCDTHADPRLSSVKVNNSCVYIANESHPDTGQPFTPLTNNIMSYTPHHCRTSFTQEQKNKIFDNIFNLQSISPTISTSCQLPYIVGASAICGGTSKTYTFITI